MDGVFIPYLPAGIWLAASAFLLLLLLVCFGSHIWMRRRLKALIGAHAAVQDLAVERNRLQNETDALQAALDARKEDLLRLDAERREQEILRADLERLKREISDGRAENGRLQAGLEEKRQSLAALERRAGDLDTGKEEAESLARDLERLRQEAAGLQDAVQGVERTRIQAASLAQDIQKLSERKKALEAEAGQIERKLVPLREDFQKEKDALDALRREAENARELRDGLRLEAGALQAGRAALETEKGRLEQEIAALRSPSADGEAYADLLDTEPACLRRADFSKERSGTDESAILSAFRTSLGREGFLFSDRVIDAFHTSLKCGVIAPLTVLAGVSGTGKTLLPMRYAEFMGMHRLVLAVQPRWDSPQDMFGFYNYLERRYRATDLSRALVRMDPHNFPASAHPGFHADVRDRMLLILLDEMNLARTEYYFSEFLSRLELRRLVRDAAIPAQRAPAEVELDSGPRSFRLWVPENVLFVGTMNEDESTQALSDKVLDRANVLRFGRPARAGAPAAGGISAPADGFLSARVWKEWMRSPDDAANTWRDEALGWLDEINGGLDAAGRPFGFRMRQAVMEYVANYPRVNEDGRFKAAFADQVEQKILPRLRGLDAGDPACADAFAAIEAVLARLDDQPLAAAFDDARRQAAEQGMFHWRGVAR